MGLWNCSDSVALSVFSFCYWTLELFRECGIVCFSIGLWTCSDSVALLVFLLNFETVPTLWHYLFFYWTLELFRECVIIGFKTQFALTEPEI
jgi:hypothetical protein